MKSLLTYAPLPEWRQIINSIININNDLNKNNGGEGGIRTPDTHTRILVFESNQSPVNSLF